MSKFRRDVPDRRSMSAQVDRCAVYFKSGVARGAFLARCRACVLGVAPGAPPAPGESLSVLCGTWNVGDKKPPKNLADLDEWLPPGAHDIYAIGFQENSNKKKWVEALERHLAGGRAFDALEARLAAPAAGPAAAFARDRALACLEAKRAKGSGAYALVASSSLWDIHVLVFARRDLKRRLSRVAAHTEATGFAHVLGNKGAAAVALSFEGACLGDEGLDVMFVTSHLAARATRVAERQSNVEEINGGLRRLAEAAHPCYDAPRDRMDALHQFDHVFWFGDLNYRVDRGAHGSEAEFEATLGDAEAGRVGALVAGDQLAAERLERAAVFATFEEGAIAFPPTYRLVKGAPAYSNKKNQNPSYCDRVLYKSNAPPSCCSWVDGAPPGAGHHRARQNSYGACFSPGMSNSDHRAVAAAFDVPARPPRLCRGAPGALDGAFVALEDCVFSVAPEVSPRKCETYAKYDGYAGPLCLSLRAPWLHRGGDRASFGASSADGDDAAAVAAACANPRAAKPTLDFNERRLRKRKDTPRAPADDVALAASSPEMPRGAAPRMPARDGAAAPASPAAPDRRASLYRRAFTDEWCPKCCTPLDGDCVAYAGLSWKAPCADSFLKSGAAVSGLAALRERRAAAIARAKADHALKLEARRAATAAMLAETRAVAKAKHAEYEGGAAEPEPAAAPAPAPADADAADDDDDDEAELVARTQALLAAAAAPAPPAGPPKVHSR